LHQPTKWRYASMPNCFLSLATVVDDPELRPVNLGPVHFILWLQLLWWWCLS